MLIGMIIMTNITFYRIFEDGFNIMNQVFCTLNGLRIWFPFLIYFICRKFKSGKIVAYYMCPADVTVAECFVDNLFVSTMTSLSISQFWNLELMQLSSITDVVGVSFVVTLFASVTNHIWENRMR